MATFSISEPGSVMAMKLLPLFGADRFLNLFKKILLEDIGLERRTGFAGDDDQCLAQIDLASQVAMICSGSVESTMWSAGKPSC